MATFIIRRLLISIPVFLGITILIFTKIIASFGVETLAGYGMGSRLEFLLVPIAFAFGVASVPMVGMAMGAGLVSRARQEHGLDVSLRDLFTYPTISGLADQIASRRRVAAAPIQVVAPASDYAVSYGQRRLWVLEMNANRSIVPGIVQPIAAIRDENQVNAELFRGCVEHTRLVTKLCSEEQQAFARVHRFSVHSVSFSHKSIR